MSSSPTLLRRLVRRSKLYLRAMRGTDIWPKLDVSLPYTRLGNDGAEWAIDLAALDSNSVVYSFGVGNDISFDLGLVKRVGCPVYAFDPTPEVAKWIDAQALPELFRFTPVGLSAKDGELIFAKPDNPEHISHSVVKEGGRGTVRMKVRALESLMKELGHSRVDLLKMDIEGAEYEVLESLVVSGIRPRQLAVEFHHRWPEVGVNRTRDAIAKLRGSGYRCFAISESGEEMSFVHAPISK